MRAVNPDLHHQAHAPITLRLRRTLEYLLSVDQCDIGSIARRQLKPDHEFGNVHAMLDKSPTGPALLVSLVQQTTRNIVAVLSQEPGTRSRQAVDQRKRSLVENAL